MLLHFLNLIQNENIKKNKKLAKYRIQYYLVRFVPANHLVEGGSIIRI